MIETKKGIREVTRNLVLALHHDRWPSYETCVQFGIRSDLHYGALQYAVLHDGVSPKQLDAALGSGPEIQKLISERSPHRYVTFQTDRDPVLKTMLPGHPRWPEFMKRLNQALNREADGGCPGDMSNTRSVLTEMEMDVERSLNYFISTGCNCDCQVLVELP